MRLSLKRLMALPPSHVSEVIATLERDISESVPYAGSDLGLRNRIRYRRRQVDSLKQHLRRR